MPGVGYGSHPTPLGFQELGPDKHGGFHQELGPDKHGGFQELGPESRGWVMGPTLVHKTTKQNSRQLSLILVDNAAQLVSWVHGAEGRHGRIVRQDAQGRIVWSIPGITPVLSLSEAYVIHPALGTHASREKGRHRPSNETTQQNRIAFACKHRYHASEHIARVVCQELGPDNGGLSGVGS